jgi:ParB/RepB/Spo0J family partition protein
MNLKNDSLKLIPVKLIDPSPFGIRRDKELRTLAGSIQKLGVISPIRVRPKKPGRFEVVYGDRRLEEAKATGLKEIRCIVQDATDKEALILHVTENCARKNFNPVEEAEAYNRLKGLGFQTKQIARLVGKSEAAISNGLALLDLPEKVQDYIRTGKLTMTLGLMIERQIPSKFQEHIADQIINKKYGWIQAASYIESMGERFKLELYPEPPKDTEGPEDPTGSKRGPKDDFYSLLDEKKKQVEEKLQNASSIDHMNLSSLHIWRLAQKLEPKLRWYPRILCTREEALKAIEQDLVLLKKQVELVSSLTKQKVPNE